MPQDDVVLVVWTASFTAVDLAIPCSSGSFVVTDYLKYSANSASCGSDGILV
jgi:hypothetical protein